jgi:hypothetical protein
MMRQPRSLVGYAAGALMVFCVIHAAANFGQRAMAFSSQLTRRTDVSTQPLVRHRDNTAIVSLMSCAVKTIPPRSENGSRVSIETRRQLVGDASLLLPTPNRLRANTAQDALHGASHAGVGFRENRGQVADMEGHARPDILFTTSANGTQLFFRRNGMHTVFLRQVEGSGEDEGEAIGALKGDTTDGTRPPEGEEENRPSRFDINRVDMTLEGANPSSRIETLDPVEGELNFYLAHCPDGVTGVREYDRIVYREIYPNIDLEYVLSDGRMKYSFVVRPGGNPKDIRMRYHGMTGMRITDAGTLEVATPLGTLEEGVPYSYAGDAGVPSRFALQGDVVSFDIGAYDRASTLVIDPAVMWSTLYGGSSIELATDLTVDSVGNVLVAGETGSIDFPVLNAMQNTKAGAMDILVVKLTGNGTRIWATYYGGSGAERLEWSHGLAVTSSGDVVVTGETYSRLDFPVYNAYQSSNNSSGGPSEAFIVKFDANGTRIWATYFGGEGWDERASIAVDGGGNIFITFGTTSRVLPTLNAFQSKIAGGQVDMCLAKFSPTGGLIWCTYFGGSGEEYLFNHVATDRAGDVCIAGATASVNFPVQNEYQNNKAGGWDIVIAKFSGSGALLWSTYFGGDKDDGYTGPGAVNGYGLDIATDLSGNVVVTGGTLSPNFPVKNPTQSTFKGGNADAFVTKLSGSGALLWSTFLGGSNDEAGCAIATDRDENVLVTGYTKSIQFPLCTPMQSGLAGAEDVFITKLSAAGVPILSTYYGGVGLDIGYGIAADASGNIFVAGETASSNFPLLRPFQSLLRGGRDCFILKIGECFPNVSIDRHPVDVDTCAGPTVRFTASASSTWIPPSIHWEESTDGGRTWQDIPGAILDVLSVATYYSNDGHRYRAVAKNACDSAATDPALLRVKLAPIIQSAPVDRDTCAGSMVTFAVSWMASPPPAIQWLESSDGGVTWHDMPGRTADTLGIMAIVQTSGHRYRARLTNSCGTALTRDASLTVYRPPTVTRQPLSADTCAGASVTFTTNGTGTLPMTMRWQESADSGASWQDVAGNNDVPLNIQTTGAMNGRYYRAVYTNRCGMAISNTAVLGVRSAPRVLRQPVDTSMCTGLIAMFTVDAAGNGCAFHWQEDRGTGFNDLTNTPPYSGADDTTLHIGNPTSAMNGYRYRCIVTGACLPADTSLAATLTVYARPAALVLPAGPLSICEGDSTILTAGAGSGWNYQWLKDGVSIAGATAARYQAKQAGSYRVAVTDANGCPDTSSAVAVMVNPLPTAGIQGPAVLCPNAEARYALRPSANLTVRWTVEGGVALSALTNDTIRVRWPVGGTLRARVRDDATGCEKDTALVVSVTATLVPGVTADKPLTLCAGDSVMLEADAGYTSYLWNTGEPTRRIASRTTGSYRVWVRDTNGCAGTSEPIAVTIRPDLVPLVTVTGPTRICAGDSVTLVADSGYVMYVWNTGATSRMITVRAADDYTVRVTDSAGCTGSSQRVTVSVSPLPTPTVSGPSGLCPGDSIVLDAGAGWSSHRWSTGETTRMITVRSGGTYTVAVETAEGCRGISPPHIVTLYPQPLKPLITQRGDTLESTPSQSYQWYCNGMPIAGATYRTLVLTRTGSYTVLVVDGNGCPSTSDRQDLTAVTTAALACPTRAEIAVGETVRVPLMLNGSSGLNLSSATAFSARVRLDGPSLEPAMSLLDDRRVNNERILTVSGNRAPSQTEGTLLELSLRGLLGTAPCTRVLLDSLWWNDIQVRVVRGDAICEICVKICEEGGARLFDGAGRVQLFQNRPNPFNTMTEIDYEVIERGVTRLYVSDMLGRRVATLVDGEVEPGLYRVRFDAGGLSSGSYVCVLITPSSVLSILMIVAE